MSTGKGWIGIDLDGTLAYYEGWVSIEHIGEPIWPMLDFVKRLIESGQQVKIFTARCFRRNQALLMPLDEEYDEQRNKAFSEADLVEKTIHEWCALYGLPKLEITCTKDFGMIMLYDDRCTQVETNTGRLIQ